jgi:glycosyltransferase involved in cell wall biosynthesis
MYLGLPILAYRSTAVPYTLGDAGILFNQKNYEALAEMLDLLIKDASLQTRLIQKQKERVQQFLEPQAKQQLHNYLKTLKLI